MSNNIPLELQEEIIIRVPVKSLIRFRCVSKAWKSLIESPRFITAHRVRHAQSHHLVVRYNYLDETQKKIVCIVDDHTFPNHKFTPTIPLSIKRLKNYKVVGSSHGLFCFTGLSYDSLHYLSKKMAVLWNPSIRKSIAISLPNAVYADVTVCGFGVSSVTGDLKILTIYRPRLCSSAEVKVFNLSSGVWRILNLPSKLGSWEYSPVVTDRFIYWLVIDKVIDIDGCYRRSNVVISFDLTNDEFGEVHLPDNLAQKSFIEYYKIKESLTLIENKGEVNSYNVWMMEDGVPNSFIKVFTIETPFVNMFIVGLLGFRKNGEPILKMQSDYDKASGLAALAVYESSSQQIKHMDYNVISGSGFQFSVFLYTETLLLLNQPRFQC